MNFKMALLMMALLSVAACSSVGVSNDVVAAHTHETVSNRGAWVVVPENTPGVVERA